MKLRAGATLQSGKYLLSQPLESDGMGATYIATQTLLKQSVVLKTLDSTLQVTQSFPQIRARFIEQSRLLARSQHPSLVRVVDFFEEDQLPFLVMEFVPGQTLRSRVSTPGAPPLSEAEAVHYIRQAGSALSIAHRNGLIHRNLKPDSIVRRQGTNLGVLVGFGFAHDLAIPHTLPSNPFLPPQNWQSKNPYSIDLYSLAATLYYLLSGQPPNQELALDRYGWSAATKEAIVRGLATDSTSQLQTVDDWLRLLPNTILPLIDKPAEPVLKAARQNGHAPSVKPPQPLTLPTVPVSPNGSAPVKPPAQQPVAVATPPRPVAAATQAIAPVQTRLTARDLSKSPSRFLVGTIAIATLAGLGFGVALRISAAKTPGTGILAPSQTFDEREWKGALSAKGSGSDVPIETNSAQSRVAPVPNEASPKPIESNRFVEPATPPLSGSLLPPSNAVRPLQPRSTTPRRTIKPIEPVSPVEPSTSVPVPSPDPSSIAPEPTVKPSDSAKPNPVREVAPPTIDNSGLH